MFENKKKEIMIGTENQLVVCAVVSHTKTELAQINETAIQQNHKSEETAESSNSPFQIFLREHQHNHEPLDNFALRQIWLELSAEQRRVYTQKFQAEESQVTEQPQISQNHKMSDGKSVKFSQYSLKNIVKMDPDLGIRISKDAFNAIMMSVDLFTDEIIKGSELEMKKTASKKKALKAEHLYKFISNQSYRFWFCKDLREDYARQKELKKMKTVQKRDSEKEKSTMKEKTAELNSGVKRITDFFGGPKKTKMP